MVRITLIFTLLLSALSSTAQTRVIAHRGYWTLQGSAQNSIAALRASASIGVYGSEFDVLMTSDSVLVVNHDNEINGVDIQSSTYEQIKHQKIANAEPMPTLEHYLREGQKHPHLKLIFELKPLSTPQREVVAVAKAMEIIRELGIESQVEFISFSLNVCKEFSRQSSSPVSFLGGSLSPEELKQAGLDGLDYNQSVLLVKNPQWIEQARNMGLITNSWTINDLGAAKRLIEHGVDYITTDYPEEIKLLIERQ